MKTVYLSLGSNLGNREERLQQALDRLHAADLRLVRLSSVYETQPQDRARQRWFLNMIAEGETTLFPIQLLGRIQKIEKELGRKRLAAKGPRTIDIDIILYAGFAIRSTALEVPHARYAERRFVLVPLLEIAPDLRNPVSHRPIRELLPGTAGQIVRKIDFRVEIPGADFG